MSQEINAVSLIHHARFNAKKGQSGLHGSKRSCAAKQVGGNDLSSVTLKLPYLIFGVGGGWEDNKEGPFGLLIATSFK